MSVLRRLTEADAVASASLHRRAGSLIPGYDTARHTPEEDLAFHRDQVIPDCECWGLFDGELMLGMIAMLPGWIDHLYVEPALHRCGIGSQLIGFAQARQSTLRLYTFQSNATARAFYERHGFVIEELTDGARNEDKMPDITYLWQASPTQAAAKSAGQ